MITFTNYCLGYLEMLLLLVRKSHENG